ncbi:MAG: T9SS type A sorting domain-containing protein, partial [Cytophagales bacterium]|nr:T9SS type A sorting domain-containing protein [Cytophagales bacterium]
APRQAIFEGESSTSSDGQFASVVYHVLIPRPLGLAANTNYYILVDSTAFRDLGGQSFAGIYDPAVLTFNTGPRSTQRPELLTMFPRPNSRVANDVVGNGFFYVELEFSKAVAINNGAIQVKRFVDNSVFASFDVNDSLAVTLGDNLFGRSIKGFFGEDLVIYRQGLQLEPGVRYYVDIEPGALVDEWGNTAAPIPNKEYTSFYARGVAPALTTVGIPQSLSVALGGAITLTTSIDGSNDIRWSRDGVPLNEASGVGRTSLTIIAGSTAVAGVYTASASTGVDTQVRQAPITLTVTGQFSGQVRAGGQPQANVKISAWRVRLNGSFVELPSTSTDANGNYTLTGLPLNREYIIKADGDQTKYFSTYWSPVALQDPNDSTLWEKAGRFLLSGNLTGRNINLVALPSPDEGGIGTGPHIISGTLEEEVEDELARGEARKRIANAGVVLSKQVGSQRGEGAQNVTWKVIAYLKTDELGQFAFEKLPEGIYRVQIQYPGVPMAEDAPSLNIELKPGEVSNAQVAAVITESGIIETEVNVVDAPTFAAGQLIGIRAYPNPTSGELYVQGSDAAPLVYHASGVALRVETQAVASGYRVDMSTLPPGVYYLKLSHGQHLPVVKQ